MQWMLCCETSIRELGWKADAQGWLMAQSRACGNPSGQLSQSALLCPPARLQVSAQLFSAHRQYHEGQLTKRKELVVANIHLAEAAVKAGAPRYPALTFLDGCSCL
jgi:hypothetical protein